MKSLRRLFLALALVLAPAPFLTSCVSTQTQQTARQTLLATGHSAEATVRFAGRLFEDGKISAEQLRTIVRFYDERFQPAFRAAVVASQADLAQPAPPDLAALAAQLTTLVSTFLAPRS